MFKFLKEKLKNAVSRFTEEIEEKGKEEIKEVIVEKKEVLEEPEKKGFFAKLKERFTGKEAEKEETKEIEQKKPDEKVIEEIKEKKEKIKEDIKHVKKEVKELSKEVKKEEKPKHKEEKKPEKIEAKKTKEEKKSEKKEEKETEEKKPEKIKQVPKEKVSDHAERVKEEIKIIKEELKEAKEQTAEEILKEAKEIEEVEEILEGKKPEKATAEEKIEQEEREEKKGFFARLKEKIVTKKIDEKQFDDMFWELEVGLLENNVAVEVIEKIKSDLKKKLVAVPLKRGEIENIIAESLKGTIEGLFKAEKINLIEKAKHKKPFVICFVGINGSGKTTSIAKMANLFQKNHLKVVMAAADTFRAAAIDQLQVHADKLGVKMIRHDYGSDPAAVAFDAIAHAKAKGVDVVLIDTAGRMHSNENLMDEMEKIIRVAKPDFKIFVGESITGNDCTEQAKAFNEAIGIDGIILSKADIDEKGGAAVSVSYVTGKPIIYLGTGQGYDDLKEFDAEEIMRNLGFE
jgi:fused signal recognition particle receptor